MNNLETKIEPQVGMWFQARQHLDEYGWKGACVITEVTDRLVMYYWEDSPIWGSGKSDRPIELFQEQIKNGQWVAIFPKEHYIQKFKQLYDSQPSTGSN